MTDRPQVIDRIEAQVFRVPIAHPVATSFGVMRDRPAVFVKVTASSGAFGWGETFANWPAAGAEHRARLLIEDLADLLLGRTVTHPARTFGELERAVHIRALQCGEWGPFRQVIAGIDTALSDLFARAAGLGLRHWLDPSALDSVAAYASGIAVHDAAEAIAAARNNGFGTFKVKVGFDIGRDLVALRNLQPTADERLLADANQAWSLPEALHFVEKAADLGLGWIEEPLPADAPAADWARLAECSPIALAGGENIAGRGAFDAAIASGHLAFLQPDLAKWGGVSGTLPVARAIGAAGLTYCPHFLGGGIGLVASAHLLAAVRGDGLLEIDANPNPLREAFPAAATLRGGRLHLSEAPGLGIDDLPAEIARYRTLSLSRSRNG